MKMLRRSAVLCAVPIACLGAMGVWTGPAAHVFAHGPVQAGHAEVSCRDCHVPSPGSTRQQVQAKLAHVLGRRDDPVDFGRAAVSSDQCLACHQRPNERHPIYRFREPRFIEALGRVEADSCLGCHGEHEAARVAVDGGFCVACHEDLKVPSDPVDVPHQTLISTGKWNTCLGCHDFHGNHAYTSPTRVQTMIPAADIHTYFGQGESPYGPFKLFEADAQ